MASPKAPRPMERNSKSSIGFSCADSQTLALAGSRRRKRGAAPDQEKIKTLRLQLIHGAGAAGRALRLQVDMQADLYDLLRWQPEVSSGRLRVACDQTEEALEHRSHAPAALGDQAFASEIISDLARRQ